MARICVTGLHCDYRVGTLVTTEHAVRTRPPLEDDRYDAGCRV
jgi:hypothetical protein